MSRHKLVKTMNLSDELDDFDGGGEYDYDEGLGGSEGTCAVLQIPTKSLMSCGQN